MANIQRFASNAVSISHTSPLTNEQMFRYAPSIFAEGKHESRSERYTYVPTIATIERLRREGFHPFMVGQSRSRVPGKAEFTKHIVRLRHADKADVGGSPEIVMINAHDGTASYQMLGGYFRFICMNGMVCGETLDEVRVHHKGDITQYVVDAAYEVLGKLGQVTDQRKLMQDISLNRDERMLLAETALEIRYDDPEKPAPIAAARLLDIRRADDRNNDLWTTFNVIQENTVRGGITGRIPGRRRQTTTREVTGIDQNTKLNRALWTMAEKFAALKTA